MMGHQLKILIFLIYGHLYAFNIPKCLYDILKIMEKKVRNEGKEKLKHYGLVTLLYRDYFIK